MNNAMNSSHVNRPFSASKAGVARWSLRCGIAAFVGSIAASATMGFTVVPMEATHGRTMADTPGWYQAVMVTLAASFLVWTALGIASIVTACVALSRTTSRRRPVTAIVLATCAPVVAVGVLIGSILASAAFI